MTPRARVSDTKRIRDEIERDVPMPWFCSSARFDQIKHVYAAGQFRHFVSETRRVIGRGGDGDLLWSVIGEKLFEWECNSTH